MSAAPIGRSVTPAIEVHIAPSARANWSAGGYPGRFGPQGQCVRFNPDSAAINKIVESLLIVPLAPSV